MKTSTQAIIAVAAVGALGYLGYRAWKSISSPTSTTGQVVDFLNPVKNIKKITDDIVNGFKKIFTNVPISESLIGQTARDIANTYTNAGLSTPTGIKATEMIPGTGILYITADSGNLAPVGHYSDSYGNVTTAQVTSLVPNAAPGSYYQTGQGSGVYHDAGVRFR